jgi:hypothetical protein
VSATLDFMGRLMSPTYWILFAVLLLAAGMVLWAHLTAGPGPEWRHETAREPGRHTQRNRDQDTRRLRPPAPDWIPHAARPGGEAQLLPPRDQLPWADEELRARPLDEK